MTELMQIDSYGTLIEPDTIRIQRLLPGLDRFRGPTDTE